MEYGIRGDSSYMENGNVMENLGGDTNDVGGTFMGTTQAGNLSTRGMDT